MIVLLYEFHWSLFVMVQLKIFQLGFMYRLGAEQVPSHYLNQCWHKRHVAMWPHLTTMSLKVNNNFNHTSQPNMYGCIYRWVSVKKCNSIAKALELRLTCINPSIWYLPLISLFVDNNKKGKNKLQTIFLQVPVHSTAMIAVKPSSINTTWRSTVACILEKSRLFARSAGNVSRIPGPTANIWTIATSTANLSLGNSPLILKTAARWQHHHDFSQSS